MTPERAAEIAKTMESRGFSGTTADDVLAFLRDGSLPPSVVGEEYDDAREDTLLDLLREES